MAGPGKAVRLYPAVGMRALPGRPQTSLQTSGDDVRVGR